MRVDIPASRRPKDHTIRRGRWCGGYGGIHRDHTQLVQRQGRFRIARVPLRHSPLMATGRVVTRLDYQAYSKLAIKTMANILRAAHTAHSRSDHQPTSADTPAHSLIRSAVHHRLGTVPVGEPSIVIAVSSPHRKEAFMACEQILEEVKLKAQIWKREFYEGEREEDAEWKANAGH